MVILKFEKRNIKPTTRIGILAIKCGEELLTFRTVMITKETKDHVWISEYPYVVGLKKLGDFVDREYSESLYGEKYDNTKK